MGEQQSKPGEFTTKFDREILRSKAAENDAARLEVEKERAEQERVGEFLRAIQAVVEKRAQFIVERFPGARRGDLGGVGWRFEFAGGGGGGGDRAARAASPIAAFQVRARLNDTRLAIVVESEIEIPARSVREKDYISIPLTSFDLERAKTFIETKLFDFARHYVT